MSTHRNSDGRGHIVSLIGNFFGYFAEMVDPTESRPPTSPTRELRYVPVPPPDLVLPKPVAVPYPKTGSASRIVAGYDCNGIAKRDRPILFTDSSIEPDIPALVSFRNAAAYLGITYSEVDKLSDRDGPLEFYSECSVFHAVTLESLEAYKATLLEKGRRA